ncbi:conjugal transfer protein [Gallibacterium anatis]|uniref:PFL_4669 family integrating conjugative element protein n=1 Tax=Gallibacterium anatis TaxID=750 RepID=UPI000530D490|nr:TIGR03761 family integrating conjugative element protein [Gallibacterium anatis]KGQ25116.1 conjugal transfer protein [Gallibacterium anatis]
MTTTDLQNQRPGPLRSSPEITINSHHASKLWVGRTAIRNDQGKITRAAIISMPTCLRLLSQIQRAAMNDDPYADDYLLRFETKVLDYRREMQQLIDKVNFLYSEQIPAAFHMENSVSIAPARYALTFNSQLGYQLIFLFLKFDELACAVMAASHIALMTRNEASDWIDTGAKLIRQCFGLVENYRHSGITRRDAEENNARYKAAVKRMKYELSPEILSDEKRASFAPVIKNTAQSETETVQDDGLIENGSE